MEVNINISGDIAAFFQATLSGKNKEYRLHYKGILDEFGIDTIRRKEIKLSETDWNQLVEKISGKITMSPEYRAGFDGTTYKISIENGFNSYTYQIWGLSEEDEPLWGFLTTVFQIIKKNEGLQ